MLRKKAIAAKLKCCQASLTVSKKTKKSSAFTSSSYSKSQKNLITPHTSESPDSDVEMPQNDEDPDHHSDPESSPLLPTSILQSSTTADGIAATIEKWSGTGGKRDDCNTLSLLKQLGSAVLSKAPSTSNAAGSSAFELAKQEVLQGLKKAKPDQKPKTSTAASKATSKKSVAKGKAKTQSSSNPLDTLSQVSYGFFSSYSRLFK